MANNESEAENSDLPWALAKPSSKATTSKQDKRRNPNSKYRVDELNESPPRLPGIRTLLPLPGGDLLTGGTDLKIRRWDHCRFDRFLSRYLPLLLLFCWFPDLIYHDISSPERTYCICGPSIKGVPNDDFYEVKSSFGVQVVQVFKINQTNLQVHISHFLFSQCCSYYYAIWCVNVQLIWTYIL